MQEASGWEEQVVLRRSYALETIKPNWLLSSALSATQTKPNRWRERAVDRLIRTAVRFGIVLILLSLLTILLRFPSGVEPSNQTSQTNSLDNMGFGGFIAALGAVTGVVSLFLHWYRGRPRLNLEVASGDHAIVSATNFSGTTISVDLRVMNTADTPTTIFKADMIVKIDEENSLTQTFPLGITQSETFPYVARGIMILGHETVEIPMWFNFGGVNLPKAQRCRLELWHTHGRSPVELISTLKAT